MNKLFEAIEQERPYCPDNDYDIGYNNGLVMAQAIVLKRDLEEVVRCKDCKYSEWDCDCSLYLCRHHGCDWNKGDHFCSYGERRTEA